MINQMQTTSKLKRGWYHPCDKAKQIARTHKPRRWAWKEKEHEQET